MFCNALVDDKELLEESGLFSYSAGNAICGFAERSGVLYVLALSTDARYASAVTRLGGANNPLGWARCQLSAEPMTSIHFCTR
ncbi:hypothetical protein VTN96DRAFT_1549 [Rasamsonia emersonii]